MEIDDEVVIPNFSMFDAKLIQVVLHKQPTDEPDEEALYQASVLVWLDDGSDSEELGQNITLLCDLFHTCPKQLAKITFLYATTLFNNYISIVTVIDEDGELEEEIDMAAEKTHFEGITIH